MQAIYTFPLFVRYVAGGVLFLVLAVAAASSFSMVCDGGPDFSSIKENNGVLTVRGKFGQTASTSDMGKTWTIHEGRVFDSIPFWKRNFIVANMDVYQNVPSAFQGIHVITRKKNAKLWQGSPRNFILFARGDQLFSFDGKLAYNGQTETVSLYSGEIYGTSSGDTPNEIRVKVSESQLCKITRERDEYVCRNPFSWNFSDRTVTGFHAQKNGNFFLSTPRQILYFDAGADQWSVIPEPRQWTMRCPSN